MTTNPQSPASSPTERTNPLAERPNPLTESTIHLSDVFRVLRKYIWYVLGLMILGGTLAAIWAKFQPPLYDATALVHLDQHSAINLGTAGEGEDFVLKMNTQIIGLQSAIIAESTMRKLNMQNHPLFTNGGKADLDNPVSRDQLVGAFRGSLSVTQVPKSELLLVRFRSRSPALAALVVNTLIETYFEQSFQMRYRSTKDITGYLTEQMDGLKEKIQSEQNDLLNAEAKLGILSQGGSSSQGSTMESSLLVNETTALLSQRVKVQGNRYLAEAEYQDMLNHPDASIPPDVPASASLVGLQAQLAQAQSQVAALEDRYGPQYPPLQQSKAQVASLSRSIEELRKKVLNGAAENLERAQKAEQSITDRLAELQKEGEGKTPEVVRYQILKSQYVSDQTLYNVLLSAMGTGAIQAGMQSQELNRFSAAEVPGVKSYPQVRAVATAGAAAGMLIGFVIVGIILMNSDTIQTVEQVEEALPVPILASVPEYKQDLAALRISDDVLPLVTLRSAIGREREAYRLPRCAPQSA